MLVVSAVGLKLSQNFPPGRLIFCWSAADDQIIKLISIAAFVSIFLCADRRKATFLVRTWSSLAERGCPRPCRSPAPRGLRLRPQRGATRSRRVSFQRRFPGPLSFSGFYFNLLDTAGHDLTRMALSGPVIVLNSQVPLIRDQLMFTISPSSLCLNAFLSLRGTVRNVSPLKVVLSEFSI